MNNWRLHAICLGLFAIAAAFVEAGAWWAVLAFILPAITLQVCDWLYRRDIIR